MPATLGDRPLLIASVIVYTAIVVVIGAWAARRTRTAGDFYIAGQGIGLPVIALATMSAAFSGFVFLGGPGLTYRLGVGALWIVLPVGLTGGLLCWTVARPLRMLAGIREVFTVPDALRLRFRSRSTTAAAALAVATGSVAYLASQVLALGILLQAILGLQDLVVAMGLGLVVLVAYSSAGGMIAGIYTDVAQGAIMLVAAVAVFACAVHAAGGVAELTSSIAGSESFGTAFLEPLGRLPAFAAFGFFFVFGVGVLGQPQMLHKFYMLDDPAKLRWFPLVLGGSQALCLLIWVGVGFAVPALVAQGRLEPLARPDDAAPLFLLGFAPELLAGVAVAGILAAIMSTADSFVNIAAAALVRDLPRAWGRPPGSGLKAARVATVVVGLAAWLLAAAYGDLIALLGTFGFGTFAAALTPSIAVGLNWERVTAPAATASIAVGGLGNVALELSNGAGYLRGWLAPGVPPSAVALAASFAVLFGVTWCTRPPAPAELDADIRAILRA